MIDHALEQNDFFVLLSGDLNSRTSNVSQPVTSEQDVCPAHTSDPTNEGRCSQDRQFNSYGKSMLDMCTTLNLCIMNGVCNGDCEGHYTYICDSGSSVVDYFLLSSELFAIVFDNCQLKVMERIDTRHLPVVLSISFPKNNPAVINDDEGNVVEKFIWNATDDESFKHALNSNETHNRISEAIQLIDRDIDLAVNIFNDCIRNAAVSMKKVFSMSGQNKKEDWYDEECRLKRRLTRRALRKYRHSKQEEYRSSFCIQRREYKKLLARKKSAHNASIIDKLMCSINSQQRFWETVHKTMPKRKMIQNQISVEQWYRHFSQLLEKNSGGNT